MYRMNKKRVLSRQEARWVIDDLLTSLGIGLRYRGRNAAAEAVLLVLENEDNLLKFRKRILIPVAEKLGTEWSVVDRNLRTVIAHAWKVNQEQFNAMAGYKLRREPSVVQFIDTLTVYLQRSGVTLADIQEKADGETEK